VVRWLRIDDEGRVDAGIQLLARHALPIGVRAAGHEGMPAIRGLLLAALDTRSALDYAALLVPTEVDRAAAALELSIPADQYGPPSPARIEQATSLRVIEASGTFQHFAFAPYGGAAADAAAAASAVDALSTGTFA
jgi:hypothetical protein